MARYSKDRHRSPPIHVEVEQPRGPGHDETRLGVGQYQGPPQVPEIGVGGPT